MFGIVLENFGYGVIDFIFRENDCIIIDHPDCPASPNEVAGGCVHDVNDQGSLFVPLGILAVFKPIDAVCVAMWIIQALHDLVFNHNVIMDLELTRNETFKGDKEANAMLTKVALGIVFLLAAWLIVNLITTALLDPTIETFIHG